MLDYKSVSIRGAVNYGRARVLWEDGVLKIINPDRDVLEIPADRPVKKQGYLWAWDVKTEKGDIIMKIKCMTCGGKKWWRIMNIPKSEAWGLTI